MPWGGRPAASGATFSGISRATLDCLYPGSRFLVESGNVNFPGTYEISGIRDKKYDQYYTGRVGCNLVGLLDHWPHQDKAK